MTTFSKYAPGAFSWIDLMSPDAAASKRFYTALCGWEVRDEPTDGDGGVYSQFLLRGQPVAGLGEMGNEMKASGMPAIWNSYVTVQDVGATSERAASLGAQVVMPPMKVMEAGHMAILADPTGAHLSLWQPGEHFGAGIVNEPTSLVWNELATNDTTAAAGFYRDLFGWTISEAGDDYLLIENQGRHNGGIRPLGPDQPGIPPHWGVYLAVEDCDASLARATELGGSVLVPAMDIAQGRFGVIADPQGGAITLMRVDDPD